VEAIFIVAPNPVPDVVVSTISGEYPEPDCSINMEVMFPDKLESADPTIAGPLFTHRAEPSTVVSPTEDQTTLPLDLESDTGFPPETTSTISDTLVVGKKEVLETTTETVAPDPLPEVVVGKLFCDRYPAPGRVKDRLAIGPAKGDIDVTVKDTSPSDPDAVGNITSPT
jgi:hypothetical protein